MTREQIEAWLALEGHDLAANSMFFYCLAYGREWAHYISLEEYPGDTWDNHGMAGDFDYYDTDPNRYAQWSEIPYAMLLQLYTTLVEYKEHQHDT